MCSLSPCLGEGEGGEVVGRVHRSDLEEVREVREDR